MRMYPPFTVSRRLVQEGGLVLSGYQIPAGTEVNVGCHILLLMVVDKMISHNTELHETVKLSKKKRSIVAPFLISKSQCNGVMILICIGCMHEIEID